MKWGYACLWHEWISTFRKRKSGWQKLIYECWVLANQQFHGKCADCGPVDCYTVSAHVAAVGLSWNMALSWLRSPLVWLADLNIDCDIYTFNAFWISCNALWDGVNCENFHNFSEATESQSLAIQAICLTMALCKEVVKESSGATIPLHQMGHLTLTRLSMLKMEQLAVITKFISRWGLLLSI